jgi:hypothetical protein
VSSAKVDILFWNNFKERYLNSKYQQIFFKYFSRPHLSFWEHDAVCSKWVDSVGRGGLGCGGVRFSTHLGRVGCCGVGFLSDLGGAGWGRILIPPRQGRVGWGRFLPHLGWAGWGGVPRILTPARPPHPSPPIQPTISHLTPPFPGRVHGLGSPVSFSMGSDQFRQHYRPGLNYRFCRPEFADLKFSVIFNGPLHTTKKQCFSESL